MGIHPRFLDFRVEGRVSGSDETFTHEKLGTFNISALRKLMIANNVAPFECLLPEDVGEKIRLLMTEDDRLAQIRDEDLDDPLLFIDLPNGTQQIVDGCHRLRYATRRGYRSLPGWIVPLAVAQRFMIRTYVLTLEGWRELSGREVLSTVNPGAKFSAD